MMRSLLLLVAVIFLARTAGNTQPSLTTFIFIRHAEKVNDGTKDPELSVDGKERAGRLSSMLSNQKIDAVYSTNFKRTRMTVDLLATDHNLTVKTYESLDAAQLSELGARYQGGTVVICGHSNTTPAMVNKLLGSDQLKQWDDSDYGNFVIVTMSPSAEKSLMMLRY
jgi:2,3-bisphosphoglycerate-dependent phosphoglycerate mutase